MKTIRADAKSTSDFAPGSCDDLEVHPAASLAELHVAYQLVYANYVRRGYISENTARMRFSLFNIVPHAITFVALHQGEVIATVSVIPDTPIGLPMDEIYRPELDALRREGRKLAEVTMLADRRLSMRRSFPVVLLLMKQVFDDVTLFLKANDCCITINPHHLRFYRDFLLFEPIGPERSYPSVENNPALALSLNLDTVKDRYSRVPRLWERFYQDRTPHSTFGNRYHMSCRDIEALCAGTGAVDAAPPGLLDILQQTYPECRWPRSQE